MFNDFLLDNGAFADHGLSDVPILTFHEESFP